MPIRKVDKVCQDCGASLVDDNSWSWKNSRCYDDFRRYKRAVARRYYKNHAADERARNKAYNTKHAERHKQQRKEAWEKEKTVPLEERKLTKWKAANKDKMKIYWKRARQKAYAKNPKHYIEQSQLRRARLKGAAGNHTKDEWERRIKEFGGGCIYCHSGGELTKDHLIPLARGGSHSIENIVPSCLDCNETKNAADPVQFAAKRCDEQTIKLVQDLVEIAGRSIMTPRTPYTKVTDAALISEIKRLAELHGRLSARLIKEEAAYGPSTYGRRLDVRELAVKFGVPWVDERAYGHGGKR